MNEELFDDDDIFKYYVEWLYLEEKKLLSLTRPGAGMVSFSIYMRAKMFKISLKKNRPGEKDRLFIEFPWDSVKIVNINKKEPEYTLKMLLNKEKAGYSSIIIATKPSVAENLYEVLNTVFLDLMNQRFNKSNCTQIYKNIKTLNSLEMSREKKNARSIVKTDVTIGELIGSMLTKYQKMHQIPQDPEDAVDVENTEVTVNLEPEPDEVNVHSEPEPEPENNTVDSDEEDVHLEPEPKRKTELEVEPELQLEPRPKLELEPFLGFDFYQNLNVPSIVAIVATFFVNVIYFLFLNQDM